MWGGMNNNAPSIYDQSGGYYGNAGSYPNQSVAIPIGQPVNTQPRQSQNNEYEFPQSGAYRLGDTQREQNNNIAQRNAGAESQPPPAYNESAVLGNPTKGTQVSGYDQSRY